MKRIPKGVVIVGSFHPDDKEDLRLAWEAFSPIPSKNKMEYAIQFRPPVENISHGDHSDGSAERWHQDCGKDRLDSAHAVILWSNSQPTEFKRKRGQRVWSPQPFDVVLVDNHDSNLQHRKPPDILPDNQRWTIVHRVYEQTFAEVLKAFRGDERSRT